MQHRLDDSADDEVMVNNHVRVDTLLPSSQKSVIYC